MSSHSPANGIFILSDLAYAEVFFDEKDPPPSVLRVPGANEGYGRVHFHVEDILDGWAAGGLRSRNERLIAALSRVKSYLDYGVATGAGRGSRRATVPTSAYEMRAVYRRRRDVMVETFARAGWPIPAPSASMFAWAPIPDRFRELGSVEFSKLLIEKADVAVAPGLGFGEHEEGIRAHRAGGERAAHPTGGRNVGRFRLGGQNVAQRRPNERQPLSFSRQDRDYERTAQARHRGTGHGWRVRCAAARASMATRLRPRSADLCG